MSPPPAPAPGCLVFPALRWREETGFGHEDAAIEAALRFGAGGFILFGGTADGVAELTGRLRRTAGRPLLFAADLERGPGQQVRGLDELPPPRALASLGEPAVIRGAGVLTAVEALSVGINWVLAPVADLDVENSVRTGSLRSRDCDGQGPPIRRDTMARDGASVEPKSDLGPRKRDADQIRSRPGKK